MEQRLKQKDLAKYRELQLDRQGGLCGMCRMPIKNVSTLDHSHQNGHCRSVCCRECNALEGKIVNAAKRIGMSEEHLKGFLANIWDYWSGDYSDNPIHPTHLSDNAKELKRLSKYVRSLKKQETKDKYKREIQRLKALVKGENLDCWVEGTNDNTNCKS